MVDDTARAFGRGANRRVADLVYSTILANGGSFFAAGNSNYEEGAGTALSTTALDSGLASIMAQRDTENRDLDIRAKTLVVPPELMQTAKGIVDSEFLEKTATGDPTGNPYRNAVALEVEPRLSNSDRFTGTSALAWYLFVHPQDAAVVVAFLNGKQTPTIEFFGLDHDVNTLGVHWRVYRDFGCALGDYRAAYKAKGEA